MQKVLHLKLLPITRKELLMAHAQLILHEGEKKDINKGTTKIGAKLTHQTCHVLGDQQEGEKQTPRLAK